MSDVIRKLEGVGTISVGGVKIGTCTEICLQSNFNYKKQLELMVHKVEIMTRLRIIQARDFDLPCFEGKYYGHVVSSDSVVNAVS